MLVKLHYAVQRFRFVFAFSVSGPSKMHSLLLQFAISLHVAVLGSFAIVCLFIQLVRITMPAPAPAPAPASASVPLAALPVSFCVFMLFLDSFPSASASLMNI